jgi:hypothetical protein
MLGDMLVGNVSVEILEDIFGTLGSMWHATYCGLSGNFPGNIFVQDVQLLSKMCLFFSKTIGVWQGAAGPYGKGYPRGKKTAASHPPCAARGPPPKRPYGPEGRPQTP